MKYLKLIFLTLLLLPVAGLQGQSQINAIDKYFQQYVEDERFTVVYISSKLFQMIGKLDIDKFEDEEETQAILDIAQDLEGLRILATEENAMEFYREAKSKIDTQEYEVLMTVRDRDGDNVEFLVREDGNNVIEELLLLVGGDEFVLLSFVGKLDLNKISNLAKTIEEDKK
jgi:predicted transcriptional regulator